MLSGPLMLLKQLGLDPEAITKQIQEYGNIVIELKKQMDRIEKNQLALMKAQGIEFPATPGMTAPADNGVNGNMLEKTQ